MIKFCDPIQIMSKTDPTGTATVVDPNRLEGQAQRLQSEEAELVNIAFHLSQAVTRLGACAFSLEACRDHNLVLAEAQKCQQNLQEWIVRNRAQA